MADKKFVLGADGVHTATAAVLLSSGWCEGYPTPVCVDLARAADIYKASDCSVDSALTLARVNFMGTDGLRGRVVPKVVGNCIDAFLQENAFTPDLAELMAFAFARLLLDKQMVAPGDTVVIGNDGRDLAYDWVFNSAVRSGFTKAGLNVLDLGVVPTPFVPWTSLRLGHTAAACLTASHNPSNQNGIKFFIDGKKLLPQGDVGD
ncbi:MAG: hypothetical protein FWD80_07080, partial [Propionibacteriaceae bacterium]|nr:hypothetical protein [Propionibacteriaceae bacterium]